MVKRTIVAQSGRTSHPTNILTKLGVLEILGGLPAQLRVLGAAERVAGRPIARLGRPFLYRSLPRFFRLNTAWRWLLPSEIPLAEHLLLSVANGSSHAMIL